MTAAPPIDGTFATAVAILAAHGRRSMAITTADGRHRLRCHHCGGVGEIELDRDALEERIRAHDSICKGSGKGTK